jgi:hypothetical protein
VQLVSDGGLVEADVEVTTPVVRGENQLLVALATRTGAEAELIAVDATMAAHGHRAHAASIEHVSSGFRVDALDLFMTGRWLIELELSVDGQSDRVSLPVDVP